jgi:hypothetical protein
VGSAVTEVANIRHVRCSETRRRWLKKAARQAMTGGAADVLRPIRCQSVGAGVSTGLPCMYI